MIFHPVNELSELFQENIKQIPWLSVLNINIPNELSPVVEVIVNFCR
jgi:hypothetical protein